MGMITYFTMEDFQINFFITHLKSKQIDNLQEVDVRLPWQSSWRNPLRFLQKNGKLLNLYLTEIMNDCL